ncbi:MAG: hypothetical protein AVDCRST_MAG27-3483, partial [uncultured Craurococcus sp.]
CSTRQPRPSPRATRTSSRAPKLRPCGVTGGGWVAIAAHRG